MGKHSESTEGQQPNQVIEDKLRELIRQATLVRLRSHTQCNDFVIDEVSDGRRLGQVLANRMTLVLLSGTVLRIIFKVHYNISNTKPLLAQLRKVSEREVTDQQVKDFIKEFSNLTGGYIKNALDGCQIHLGMSLPLAMRGFDEVYADYRATTHPIRRFSDFWQLTHLEHSIICTASIEVIDSTSLDALVQLSFDAAEESDELEFL